MSKPNNTQQSSSDTCVNSGRPLRSKFDGLFYLLDGAVFRIIDLAGKRDRIVTEGSLIDTIGEKKWRRIESELVVSGFYESGNYRIEVWDAPESL